jgi:hypothetical protein
MLGDCKTTRQQVQQGDKAEHRWLERDCSSAEKRDGEFLTCTQIKAQRYSVA